MAHFCLIKTLAVSPGLSPPIKAHTYNMHLMSTRVQAAHYVFIVIPQLAYYVCVLSLSIFYNNITIHQNMQNKNQ